MTSTPRSFQNATVAAAVACLRAKGSRRFLVADEVGLGKTTVAREVLRTLSVSGTKPFTAYYITSNTRVSDQNAARLVDFLGDTKIRKRSLSKVDRLSMIPLDQRRDDKNLAPTLRLYSLAPQTSFPPETTRPTPGAAVERAFLGFLLERAVPGILEKLPDRFIQQRATVSWEGACRTAKKLMDGIDPKLIAAYREALRERFNPERKRLGLATRIALESSRNAKSAPRTLTILRRLLAEACLAATPPDLIIFDEFQRFRELLAPAVTDRLGRALLGIGGKKPAMLLLSATPYRLYGESWDGKEGKRAHEELYETIEFLTQSKETRERAEMLFATFGEILRAIGDAEGIDPLLRDRASEIRDELDDLLRPHIARTERPQAVGAAQNTLCEPLAITVSDLKVFTHFAEPLSDRYRTAAAAYWLSVPLPAQALGQRYKISENIEFKPKAGVPQLRSARRTNEGKEGWGSPKLRALQQIAKREELALPWVAPSMHWWPLAGPWAGQPTQKTLIFSRFSVTPPSIAALVSLGVEDAYLDAASASRKEKWASKRLAPQAGLPVMALFHPSPFLIRATDPLKGRWATAAQAKRTVLSQLRGALHKLGISVRKRPKRDAERGRAVWTLLAGIERRSDDFDASQDAWIKTAQGEAVLGRILSERAEAEPIVWISERELGRLADIALAAPAIVAGRAWRRHFPDAIEPDHLGSLVAFCWNRLRLYLDNRIFWGRLGKGSATDVLLAATRDGGFESVLDEHFWLALGQTEPAQLIAELGSALHASLGWFIFRAVPTFGKPIRLRCHAAVPFSGTDSAHGEAAQKALNEPDVEEPPRAEGLRRAFNTPFWPHMLATTSIGQEGLDFHSWCRRIVHWDLPSNPVDLEQREGRISRYGGLHVRRPLGETIGSKAVPRAANGSSPWVEAGKLADAGNEDDSGLSPWWTFPAGNIHRHVLALTKSRDIARFDHLQRQRLLYRLALGQPNQEDLVNHLARGSSQKIVDLSELALDLRPDPLIDS